MNEIPRVSLLPADLQTAPFSDRVRYRLDGGGDGGPGLGGASDPSLHLPEPRPQHSGIPSKRGRPARSAAAPASKAPRTTSLFTKTV